MSKIFVRNRRDVGKGAGRPRFAIVAVSDLNLQVLRPRIRRIELEQIAAETGAEIVYLRRGEGAGEGQDEGGAKRRRRRQKG